MGYKKDIFDEFAYEFEPLQNDISLRNMIYGWHRMRYFHFAKIWYNIRSFICRRHISPTEGGYHIKDISPVPQGTDIIEKRQVSVETCRFSWLRKVGLAVRLRVLTARRQAPRGCRPQTIHRIVCLWPPAYRVRVLYENKKRTDTRWVSVLYGCGRRIRTLTD